MAKNKKHTQFIYQWILAVIVGFFTFIIEAILIHLFNTGPCSIALIFTPIFPIVFISAISILSWKYLSYNYTFFIIAILSWLIIPSILGLGPGVFGAHITSGLYSCPEFTPILIIS